MPFDRKKLIEIRYKRKLNPEQVSRGAGLDDVCVRRIESGETKQPYFSTIEKLASFLDVKMEDLCNDEFH